MLCPVITSFGNETALRYRDLGTTGLSVSVLGFGASTLGNVFGEVEAASGERAVRHSVDCGINLFDVSPYYGITQAEQRLGAALEGRRQEVLVATKCGRYGLDEFDFSAHGLTERFEDSLRRLRTDYVDLLQVHDIEFGDIDQIVSETLPAIRRLQEQGKVRFVGITGYWPGVLTYVARRAPVDTILNYCHSNLMMDDMDRVLTPFVRESGVGLLNASPMHMGLLAGVDVPEWHPAPETVRVAAAEIVALCQSAGVAPSAVALSACLSHPVAASTLVGMSSEAQVDANCAALEFQPSEELVRALNEAVAPVFNTSWPQGRPENVRFGAGDSFRQNDQPRGVKVFEKIDAHHHLWSYTPDEFGWIDGAMQPLRRDFLLADLKAQARLAQVEATVVVQARQSVDETRWLLELASTCDLIRGVVGWLPIASSSFPALLDEFAEQPGLKGLRHVVQAEEAGFLDDSSFNRGIRMMRDTGLVYDLLVFARQLKEVTRFVDRHPNQLFVLDHVGKPAIAKYGIESWSEALRELARRPNVSCKISGLVTEADWKSWTPADLEPYFMVALEAFGAERLMVGTDWPVLTLGCTYEEWWHIVEGWIAPLSRKEQANILGRVAKRVYRLSQSSSHVHRSSVVSPRQQIEEL